MAGRLCFSSDAVEKGVFFFDLLQGFYGAVAQAFRPRRTVIGRLSENYPMPWTVEWREGGGLSISGSSPGPVTDKPYERQQMINCRLDGQMVAAYIVAGDEVAPSIIEDVREVGFEALIVQLESQTRYSELIGEIDKNSLWDTESNEQRTGRLLMLTPFGFRCISTVDEFKAWLPKVNELEVVATGSV